MAKIFNFHVILIFMTIYLTIGDGLIEAISAGSWENLANTNGTISKTESSKKFSSANVGSSKTESDSLSSSSSSSDSSSSSSSDSLSSSSPDSSSSSSSDSSSSSSSDSSLSSSSNSSLSSSPDSSLSSSSDFSSSSSSDSLSSSASDSLSSSASDSLSSSASDSSSSSASDSSSSSSSDSSSSSSPDSRYSASKKTSESTHNQAYINGVGSDNSTSIKVVTGSDKNGLTKDEDTSNKKTITISWGSGWNFIGNDLKNFTGTIMDCRIQCVKEKQCTHFTHVEGNPSICYLKKGVIHKNNATKESNEYSSAIFHRHKTQNKRSTCRSKNYCYGFGDPHYRSIYGEFMNIADKCSYILYSDNCVQNTKANTEVVVDQEERRPGVDFMKTFRIKVSGSIFLVGKNLKVDGILYDLPYKDNSLGVIVQRKGQYIVFDHPKFSLSFDGGYKLKMRICDLNTCGLCNTKKNSKNSYHEFLSFNSQCSI